MPDTLRTLRISKIELAHYEQLKGHTILDIEWTEINGDAAPVLKLSGNHPGHTLFATVQCDPEGNGPGFLDIQHD